MDGSPWFRGAQPHRWAMVQCRVALVADEPLEESNQERTLRMENVVIIGSGCAGLTAAIYAARANLKPVVLEGHEPGGQLSLTTHVENFPGFPDGILGPELIENMKRQAARFGAEFRAGAVTEVDLRERPFRVTVAGETLETKTVIVAPGGSPATPRVLVDKEMSWACVLLCV